MGAHPLYSALTLQGLLDTTESAYRQSQTNSPVPDPTMDQYAHNYFILY